jgi:hypothetical protein
MSKVFEVKRGFYCQFRDFDTSPRLLNFIMHNRTLQGDGEFEVIFTIFYKSIAFGILYPNNKNLIDDFEMNLAKFITKK